MMEMSDAEYADTQNAIELIASIVRGLPLDAFIARAERSLEVGAYVDPTLYIKANGKLQLVLDHAKQLRRVQEITNEAAAKGLIK